METLIKEFAEKIKVYFSVNNMTAFIKEDSMTRRTFLKMAAMA